MFDAIINLISILIAVVGIAACFGMMAHEVRKKPDLLNVILAALFLIALIKCAQFAVWASLALYDKYTESAIQIHTVITI